MVENENVALKVFVGQYSERTDIGYIQPIEHLIQ